MRGTLRSLMITGVVAATPGFLSAQFADFETGTIAASPFNCGTSGDNKIIQNGYAGFNWNNFYTLNGAWGASQYSSPGYMNGTTSGNCIAFNGFGAPSTVSSLTPFSFNGGWFTAAFTNGLSLSITAFNGATQLFQSFLTLDTQTPQQLAVLWDNVDRVEFASGTGTPGSQFVFDDFRFNNAPIPSVVPEPASLVLLGSGLLGLAAVQYRRRRV